MSFGTNGPADLPGATHATVLDDAAPELTRRYAEALLGAAESSGVLEPALDELDELIADVWDAQPDFAALLASPTVATAEKDRILVRTFEGRTLPVVLNFLRVLNRHSRMALLRPIARRARALLERRLNRRPVTVRSAQPLDDDQLDILHARLTGLLQGATPVLELAVDPNLLGGLVIQIGDHVYDASLRDRLRQLRQRLVEEKTHELLTRSQAFMT